MIEKSNMEDRKPEKSIIGLLQKIAMISGMFAFVLCILIIVNYGQLKRTDPLNSPVLKTLVDRLKEHPEDQQLRAEVREIDLLARKAFFTSRWQIRTGGILLLIALLIVITCLKVIDILRPVIPGVPSSKNEDFRVIRKGSRKWIAYSGVLVVLIALLLAFLTHRELGRTFDDSLMVRESQSNPSVEVPSEKGEASTMKPAEPGKQDSLTGNRIPTADFMPVSMEGFPTQKEILNNWPAFRGPDGLGISYQKNIPTEWNGKSGKNILWKAEIPLSGYNSPIIWNDRIFLSGANESRREIYCIDANNGEILWNVPVEKIQGTPPKAPIVNKETGQSAPTLTTDGRRVYAIFANGDLIAVDFNGNPVWSKNLGVPQNHYGHASSLIMYHDLLLVQYDQRGSASIMALAGKTGEVVWKTARSVQVSWASPVLINTGKQREIVLAADPYVAAYNPVDGKEIWRLDCISGEVGPSLAYAGGVLYSVNEYSKLAAIQTGEAPKLIWEDSEYLSDVPSPVATDSCLFLATSYGTVVCYDSRTGKKNWIHEFGNTTYASPVLAEGKIYLMEKTGVMHIFRAGKTFSLDGEPALGEGSVCTPAFADGRIFIRGDRNLYCIGKK